MPERAHVPNGLDSPLTGLDEDVALRSILEGTATETGEGFFAALVENLCSALGTSGAWVTEYQADRRRLEAMAFWLDGELVPDYAYELDGTPCEPVVDHKRLVHVPDKVLQLYPTDPDLRAARAVSYMGVPLTDVDGTVLGHLAVLDRRPMPEEPRLLAVFRIFAARAAAEMRRLRAEVEVREREEKLSRLVGGAMDAIIELDDALHVTHMNRAAEKVFGCTEAELQGRDFGALLEAEARDRLEELCRELEARTEGEQHLWIAGGLTALRVGGEEFPAEATLSRLELGGRSFFTLILRNVNERLEAERRISTLTAEAEYLRDEIRELLGADEIMGASEALQQTLRDVQQVAGTDATVLMLGETGTGKELVARAIHASSDRRARPFVKVNCAAIPAGLMESEFFGHVKGAFTGATQRRDGRFTLSDRGTIFLDEIGELPRDLQAKLLRVLQEGEFEPVGSSETKRVDVRVVAATNRELSRRVEAGEFRQDLYYRLNVFPITVPPLRERRGDVPLLAEAFAARAAQRMGRRIEPLSAADARRLESYPWPGNVRELQNVMERAVITARKGRLNLDAALPDAGAAPAGIAAAAPAANSERADPAATILTAADLKQLERDNILRALDATGWQVSGERGAASLLGMRPSTLSSRMRALGITRSR